MRATAVRCKVSPQEFARRTGRGRHQGLVPGNISAHSSCLKESFNTDGKQDGHFKRVAPRCERLLPRLAYTPGFFSKSTLKKISPLHVEMRAEYGAIPVLQAGLLGIDRAQEGKDTLGYFGSLWIVALKFLSFAERAPHRHSTRWLR